MCFFVRVTVIERDRDRVAAAVGDGRVPVDVRVTVSVPDDVRVIDGVPDDERVIEGVPDDERVIDDVTVDDRVMDDVILGVCVVVYVAVPEGDAVRGGDSVRDGVRVAVGDSDCGGVAVGDGVALGHGWLERLRDVTCDAVAVLVQVRRGVTADVAVCDADRVGAMTAPHVPEGHSVHAPPASTAQQFAYPVELTSAPAARHTPVPSQCR